MNNQEALAVDTTASTGLDVHACGFVSLPGSSSTLHDPHAGVPILNRVDLKLPPGSRMLLVGGNGAGKTTLLQILAGKHMVPQVRRYTT